MKIDQATASTTQELAQEVHPRLSKIQYLEEAAQDLVASLYQRFEDSIVIARAFVTVPYDALPESNKTFVANLAKSAGGAADLKPATPVLSLIGSAGQEPDWNNRRNSKGHVGIPLISASFVDQIPMISRLLKELGVPITWIDSHDSSLIAETLGGGSQLFYVDDAPRATDAQNRKIIAAQDFVDAYQVRSVFGTGGVYPTGQIIVIVVFCRDAFTKDIAQNFVPLADQFKEDTTNLVRSGQVFAD